MSLEELEVCEPEVHTLQKVKRVDQWSHLLQVLVVRVPTRPYSPSASPEAVTRSSSNSSRVVVVAWANARLRSPDTANIATTAAWCAACHADSWRTASPRRRSRQTPLGHRPDHEKRRFTKNVPDIFVFRKEDHCVNEARPSSLSGKIIIL